MDLFIVVLLVALALFLAVLEIFFLPGITIAGIAGVLFAAGAVIYAFAELGVMAGWLTVAAAALGLVVTLWAFMRSKTLERISLKTEIDSVAPTTVPAGIRPGDCGVAVTRLNPMGTVLIGTHPVEAKAVTEWIDEERPVVVERIERTCVVVREA